MPSQPIRDRLLTVALSTALAAGIAAAPAAASPAIYNGISSSGKVAFFSTDEALVPGDTDHERDVYVRSYDDSLERHVTREVSVGPSGGNDALPAQYAGASADGDKVFFSTKEPLTSADKDRRTDVYLRDLAANTTTLVSRGSASCEVDGCGNGAFDAGFAPGGLDAAGDRLFFVTDEKLAPADQDASPDIYVRDLSAVSASTALVSEGASDCALSGCGNGAFGATFNAVSANGPVAVFSSNEPLSAADTDARQDVYVRNLETQVTRLASTPRAASCPGADCEAVYGGVSEGGAHVFFETKEQISAADEDSSQDVYDWSGAGAPALASTGSGGGNGAFNATYAGASLDGSVVYFETSERLEPANDTDSAQDLYARAGAATTLLSTGPLGGNGGSAASREWVSPDGSAPAAVFSTPESLTVDDTDSAQDVYLRAAGATTLLSTGPSGGNGILDAFFAGASQDGSHFFFISSEALVPADQDTRPDIYARAAGTTTLVSIGPVGGNGAFGSGLVGVSEDGLHAFFTTEERLTEGDPDAEIDVYERSPSGTLLVSTGNLLSLGPAAPTLSGTNPAVQGASTTPSVLGQAEAGSDVKLYTNSSCTGEPALGPGGEPAAGSAAQLEDPGIAVAVAAGSKTTFYATAEAGGIVSPCSAGVSYKQEAPAPPPPDSEGGSDGGGTTTTQQPAPTAAGSSQPASGGTSTQGGRVQLVVPHTLITFGPASKTRKRKAVFRFGDATGQPGSRFRCRLDRRAWQWCSSPKRVSPLKPGSHLFAVKAVNAAGTWEPQPAKRGFRVVRP